MSDDEEAPYITRNDFIIRIRPNSDDKGEWSGDIDISIIPSPDSDLNDEGYDQIMHFCKMMCSTVPIMEESPEIRNLVHEYVMNVVDNEMEIDVELEEEMGVEKTYDVTHNGNVVHLTFNTKTGGSA